MQYRGSADNKEGCFIRDVQSNLSVNNFTRAASFYLQIFNNKCSIDLVNTQVKTILVAFPSRPLPIDQATTTLCMSTMPARIQPLMAVAWSLAPTWYLKGRNTHISEGCHWNDEHMIFYDFELEPRMEITDTAKFNDAAKARDAQ